MVQSRISSVENGSIINYCKTLVAQLAGQSGIENITGNLIASFIYELGGKVAHFAYTKGKNKLKVFHSMSQDPGISTRKNFDGDIYFTTMAERLCNAATKNGKNVELELECTLSRSKIILRTQDKDSK